LTAQITAVGESYGLKIFFSFTRFCIVYLPQVNSALDVKEGKIRAGFAVLALTAAGEHQYWTR
jgi:hypothetical protein